MFFTCLDLLDQFWTACIVFGPLLWSELRWWSPSDMSKHIQLIVFALVPIAVLSVTTVYGISSIPLFEFK